MGHEPQIFLKSNKILENRDIAFPLRLPEKPFCQNESIEQNIRLHSQVIFFNIVIVQ